MKNLLTNQFNGLFELAFPRLCSACQQRLLADEKMLCLRCEFTLPETLFQHSPQENILFEMFVGRTKIEAAVALYYFQKQGRVQNLIHELKYRGVEAVGHYLGHFLGEKLKQTSDFTTINLIVPVPLHAKKKRQRGFNQSDSFAEGMAAAMQIEWAADALVRRTDSATQTKKNLLQRWRNVSTVFAVNRPELLKNKHILLVDDVITTGSTLEACAQKILEIPNTRVSVASIAFASQG